MNPIQHLRLYSNTKALMSFVDSIIYFYGRKQIFIIDGISNIIDMEMYSFFKENYGIHIFEQRGLVFEIKVLSGTPEHCIDVTSQYPGLVVPFDANLFILYSLNGIHFQQMLDADYAYKEEPASICFNLDPSHLNITVMGKRVEDIQQHIYQHMKYAIKAPHIKYNTTVINCLHICLEDDIIQNIASTNKMAAPHVRHILEERYISAIRDNFEKYDNILVFQYNKTIVDFLERENYVYELFENSDTILSVVRSTFCNHIFIGKANSTLSYYIGLNIKNKILV